MFFRANMLVRKFGRCSAAVKITLFKSYCLNTYDSALWYHYTTRTLNRLQTCYNKCIEILFGYSKRFSVTQMLFEFRLPSFATVLLNGIRLCFAACGARVSIVLYSFYPVCHCSFFTFLSIYVCRFCLSTLLCVCVIWALCLK